MPDAEFFRISNNSPLPLDAEENRYIWRQYTDDSWYVRVSDSSVVSVFIKVDEEIIPLEKYYSDDCFTLSEATEQRVDDLIKSNTGHKQNPRGYVALLNLWGSSGKELKLLQPPLYIEPGNLSVTDFDAIITRLQGLASFQYSPTLVLVRQSGSIIEGGTEDDEDECLKHAAEKFLALIKQVQSDWTLVQTAASRETRLLPKLVDVSSASGSSSSRLVFKAAQHPHARRVEILMPQESFDTVENRFIVYVLQEIKHWASIFKGQLEHRADEINKEWETTDCEANKSGKKASEKPPTIGGKKQKEYKDRADKFKSIATDITGSAEKVAPYINDPFFREVRDRPIFPSRPTDRLTRSFAYGPIYRVYCDYKSQPGISFTPLKPGLMQALSTKAIHPACTLYELWVFVEIYDMLMHTFGFRPPADAVSDYPFDYVDAKAGEIVSDALKGHRFHLEFRPLNNQQRVIKVSLWYDTAERERRFEGGHLRPDIYLEIADSKTGSLATPFTFAIDAKYRNYPGYYYRAERQHHNVDTVYDLDLLITAKEKYHERLGCNAAFVVHPDSNKRYSDWGGGPDKQNVWPGPKHQYGAVFANPSDTSSLRKLLKCFLMYHTDIENICWSCRSEVEARNILSKSKFVAATQYDEAGHVIGTDQMDVGKQPAGNDYLCVSCQRSWTRTWCHNSEIPLEHRQIKHRILNIGADNFHDRGKKGAICPTCGNGKIDNVNKH